MSSTGAGAAGPPRPGEGRHGRGLGRGEWFGARRWMRPGVQHTWTRSPGSLADPSALLSGARTDRHPVHSHPTQPCGSRLTFTEPHAYPRTHSAAADTCTCRYVCVYAHIECASAVHRYCTFLEDSHAALPTQVHSSFSFVLRQNVQARETCLSTSEMIG